MSKTIARYALAIMRNRELELPGVLERYETECAYYRGLGYRPHYCVHGVSMWVDYDCACGTCESGIPLGVWLRSQALSQANEYASKLSKLVDWLVTGGNLIESAAWDERETAREAINLAFVKAFRGLNVSYGIERDSWNDTEGDAF